MLAVLWAWHPAITWRWLYILSVSSFALIKDVALSLSSQGFLFPLQHTCAPEKGNDTSFSLSFSTRHIVWSEGQMAYIFVTWKGNKKNLVSSQYMHASTLATSLGIVSILHIIHQTLYNVDLSYRIFLINLKNKKNKQNLICGHCKTFKISCRPYNQQINYHIYMLFPALFF